MIRAFAVAYGDGSVALFLDRARAELHAAEHHGTLHQLVEREPVTPVPRDEIAAMWREACVRCTGTTTDLLVDFARRVERAHGIGG